MDPREYASTGGTGALAVYDDEVAKSWWVTEGSRWLVAYDALALTGQLTPDRTTLGAQLSPSLDTALSDLPSFGRTAHDTHKIRRIARIASAAAVGELGAGRGSEAAATLTAYARSQYPENGFASSISGWRSDVQGLVAIADRYGAVETAEALRGSADLASTRAPSAFDAGDVGSRSLIAGLAIAVVAIAAYRGITK